MILRGNTQQVVIAYFDSVKLALVKHFFELFTFETLPPFYVDIDQ